MNCANHPERERSAFCQNCGKPLCQECTRVVGSAVFCEPCLEARIAGTTPPPASAGYTASGNAGGVNFTTSATGGAYSYTDPATGFNASGPIPPPPPSGAPNPGLAALLGFIPGVGAMYNGQYAKGIVHLIIFAVLTSLADEHGIFLLFVFGWIFYQVFEAYGTAKARRDGTPLPNPFGLNDLGDRMGFGRSWPAGAPAAGAAADPAASYAPYTPPVPPAAAYAPPPANPYVAPPPAGAVPPQQQPWETPWSNYVPPANPYVANPPAFDPNAPLPVPGSRFPAGAIWLIGLGVIFLIGNASFFHGFGIRYFLPFFLIGLGAWVFIHKMTLTGTTLADDGSVFYRIRLFSALRGSVWIILVGVMFLLANFNILGWGRSWPLFIIVAGLMTIFERTAIQSATTPTAYPTSPYQTPPPASSPTSVVPPAEYPEESGKGNGNGNNGEGR